MATSKHSKRRPVKAPKSVTPRPLAGFTPNRAPLTIEDQRTLEMAAEYAEFRGRELIPVGKLIRALLVAIERVVNQQRAERVSRERIKPRRRKGGAS